MQPFWEPAWCGPALCPRKLLDSVCAHLLWLDTNMRHFNSLGSLFPSVGLESHCPKNAVYLFANRLHRTMSFIVKYSQISLHQLFIHHEILNPLYLTEYQGALDIPRCDSVMVTDSAFPPDIYHLKTTGRQSLLSPTVWDRSFNIVRSMAPNHQAVAVLPFTWSHAGQPCSLK